MPQSQPASIPNWQCQPPRDCIISGLLRKRRPTKKRAHKGGLAKVKAYPHSLAALRPKINQCCSCQPHRVESVHDYGTTSVFVDAFACSSLGGNVTSQRCEARLVGEHALVF